MEFFLNQIETLQLLNTYLSNLCNEIFYTNTADMHRYGNIFRCRDLTSDILLASKQGNFNCNFQLAEKHLNNLKRIQSLMDTDASFSHLRYDWEIEKGYKKYLRLIDDKCGTFNKDIITSESTNINCKHVIISAGIIVIAVIAGFYTASTIQL